MPRRCWPGVIKTRRFFHSKFLKNITSENSCLIWQTFKLLKYFLSVPGAQLAETLFRLTVSFFFFFCSSSWGAKKGVNKHTDQRGGCRKRKGSPEINTSINQTEPFMFPSSGISEHFTEHFLFIIYWLQTVLSCGTSISSTYFLCTSRVNIIKDLIFFCIYKIRKNAAITQKTFDNLTISQPSGWGLEPSALSLAVKTFNDRVDLYAQMKSWRVRKYNDLHEQIPSQKYKHLGSCLGAVKVFLKVPSSAFSFIPSAIWTNEIDRLYGSLY